MIDVHSHLLHEVDDGARVMDDSLEMARQAAQQGITTIIATPHHGDGRYDNPADSVRTVTQALNERLVAEDIPVLMLPGQEIHITGSLLKDLDQDKLLALGDSNYMLLELPPVLNFRMLEDLFHELLLRDIVPVLAHPERHFELMREREWLAGFIQQGGLTQITSHSVQGKMGNQIRRNANSLLREGLVHLMGSDAHDIDRRNFDLYGAYQTIENQFGTELVDYLKNNARCVVQNLTIPSTDGISTKKRRWAWF